MAALSCQRVHHLNKIGGMVEGLSNIATNLICRNRGETDVAIEANEGGVVESMK